MKGQAEESNVFNNTSLICSLVLQLIQTDEAFTVNGRTHTHTHIHTRAHTHTHTHTHTHMHTRVQQKMYEIAMYFKYVT